MTGAEQGFLLLTSRLGDPARKAFTAAQLRLLTQRVVHLQCDDPNRDLTENDLLQLGYDRNMAAHILSLLEDRQLLEYYLLQAKKAGCYPITRLSDAYPFALCKALGQERPGVLWAKGDRSILDMPRIALVGSRDLQSDNAAFAEALGRQAALQGYALVSGNARGADKLAQNACLKAGGKVISVVADSLKEHARKENVLYLSEHDFDEPFTAQRAISRNRVIHSLPAATFVAQAQLRQGGTWDGTEKNLRFGWSPVYCYKDDSIAQRTLVDMGAVAIGLADLDDIAPMLCKQRSLFD